MDDHPSAELEHLRQTCRDLQEIFRTSFDGIFVADGNGMTLMVNEGCERNYGLKAADLVGRHVSEFEKKGWIRPVIAGKVAETRQRMSATQLTHEGKTILVTGIPLFDQGGQVRRVVINSRDMTELVHLQQDLAIARENLRRADGEREELRTQLLSLEGVVLQSPAMRRIAELALRVAKVDSTVLVTGESGTGKEVLTRLIHKESARAEGPFIKINCGALPRDLLESELFGYEPGAFTGAQRQGKHGLVELASGGTLFLDEIGELPLDLQVKLLTVLQDRQLVRLGGTKSVSVDVRVVAATNRDLASMVAERKFRSDLFYRLNVVPIRIPPLAERREDILPLVRQFVDEFNRQYGFSKRLAERLLGRLHASSWPGNVRELRNVVERLLVTSPGDLIGLQDLEAVLPASGGSDTAGMKPKVQELERRLVEEAMREHKSTRAAAIALGISQSTVVRRLRAPQPIKGA
ncbi:sigma-54 interaction domain-containing protein [Ramlibacter sp. AN1133]|uniref:sigma-54 interaction domain-containing protein n=1 Tax=Ramlibacter sp. AN1133 TaxID=3133429 RepID=UPI0030C601F1